MLGHGSVPALTGASLCKLLAGTALMMREILTSIEIEVRNDPKLRLNRWQEILAKAPELRRKSENPCQFPVSLAQRHGENLLRGDASVISDGSSRAVVW